MGTIIATLLGVIAALASALGIHHWWSKRKERKLDLARAVSEFRRVEAETQLELDSETAERLRRLRAEIQKRQEAARVEGRNSPDPYLDALRKLSRLRDK